MRYQSLLVCTAVFMAALVSSRLELGPARPRDSESGTTRPIPNNVMTYEPYENGGSKLTVSNPSKPGDEWSYVTMFDGKFRPVTGQKGSETAVEVINDKEHPHLQQAGRRGLPGSD